MIEQIRRLVMGPYRWERFTELVIAMMIAAVVIAVAVNAVGVRAASKVQRGCDIPKAWGRVAFFYPESVSLVMVLEAQDGTLRFMAWNNCHVIAQANRVDLEESVSR